MALSKGSLTASQVIGSKFKDFVYRYSDKDVILYSLGIGTTVANPAHDPLCFLYEGHSRFAVHPTFATVPAMGVVHDAVLSGNFNGFQVDPKWIVLGEQYLEVFRRLPPSGVMTSRGTIADVVEKGASGIVVAVNIETFDAKTEDRYAFSQALFFVRGHREGGQGRGQGHLPRSTERIVELAEVPDRVPDVAVEERIGTDQAAIFRLSSTYDGNPLHIDDAYARAAGYAPGHNIHGVCLLGIVARHALAGFFGNDEVDRFKGVKVRVTAPVFPSDVTRSEMWREKTKTGSTRVHIRMRNLTRGTVCVDKSYVDFIQ